MSSRWDFIYNKCITYWYAATTWLFDRFYVQIRFAVENILLAKSRAATWKVALHWKNGTRMKRIFNRGLPLLFDRDDEFLNRNLTTKTPKHKKIFKGKVP